MAQRKMNSAVQQW